MDDLAREPSAERAAVFKVAAQERGLPPHVVEKDFWVCWMLRRLFHPPLVPGMAFKGGTSLSKGWNAIQRFSEDVDITIPRAGVLGMAVIDLEAELSKTQRKARLMMLDQEVNRWALDQAAGELRQRVETTLGSVEGWRLEQTGEGVEFRFDATELGYGYLKPRVLLEFGAKMPVIPSLEVEIAPYSASAGRYTMGSPSVLVNTLAPERTFWEKVTLIHALNGKPAGKIRGRVSRHFSDVAALFKHHIGMRAMGDLALLQTVATEKDRYFPDSSADYASAAAGRLRLVPDEAHLMELRRDHAGMAEMYVGSPIDLETILEALTRIEELVAERVG